MNRAVHTPPLSRAFHRAAATWLALVFSLLLLPLSAHAAIGETWDVGSKTYTDVHVRDVTPDSVTIRHSGGISQLQLADLPEHLQLRFNYDAAKARAYREAAEAKLAATLETKRRTADARDAAGRAAARESAGRIAPDVAGPVALHPSVDLRPIFSKYGLYLRDQGRRPSCSIFATVSALEYEVARRYGETAPLSEDFLIWAVRKVQPDIPIDDGYHFEDVVSALQSYGIPRHLTMPNTFGKKIEDIEPTPEALAEAPYLRHAVPVWIRADDARLLERVVERLNKATPVVIGLRWPNERALDRTNLLSQQQPLPDAGHAVTLVGYQCRTGQPQDLVFTFRNSWGVRWGAGGCGFVTAEYLQKNLIVAFYLTIPDDRAVAATTEQ